MTTLITIVNTAIEDAVRESTLANSARGTVRNIARAITAAVKGDSETYDAVKVVVSDFYETHEPSSTTPAEAVEGMSAKVTTALLSIVARRNGDAKTVAADPAKPEVVVIPETPTVEALVAVLVDLGKTAESAPESLNDDIQSALRRFGLN